MVILQYADEKTQGDSSIIIKIKNKAIMNTIVAMTTDKVGFEEIEKTAAAIYSEIAEFEARLRLYEQNNVHYECENSRLNEMLDEIDGGQASLEQYDDAAVRRLCGGWLRASRLWMLIISWCDFTPA